MSRSSWTGMLLVLITIPASLGYMAGLQRSWRIISRSYRALFSLEMGNGRREQGVQTDCWVDTSPALPWWGPKDGGGKDQNETIEEGGRFSGDHRGDDGMGDDGRQNDEGWPRRSLAQVKEEEEEKEKDTNNIVNETISPKDVYPIPEWEQDVWMEEYADDSYVNLDTNDTDHYDTHSERDRHGGDTPVLVPESREQSSQQQQQQQQQQEEQQQQQQQQQQEQQQRAAELERFLDIKLISLDDRNFSLNPQAPPPPSPLSHRSYTDRNVPHRHHQYPEDSRPLIPEHRPRTASLGPTDGAQEEGHVPRMPKPRRKGHGHGHGHGRKESHRGHTYAGVEDTKRMFCRVNRNQTILVRVGGGWISLEEYKKRHSIVHEHMKDGSGSLRIRSKKVKLV